MPVIVYCNPRNGDHVALDAPDADLIASGWNVVADQAVPPAAAAIAVLEGRRAGDARTAAAVAAARAAAIAGSGTTGPRVTSATAVVDFADGEDFVQTVTVPATDVTADVQVVACTVVGVAPDHDPGDAAIENLSAYVIASTAGVGFEVLVTAPHGTWGSYTVRCTYLP